MIYINPYIFGEAPPASETVSLLHFDQPSIVDEVGNIWTPSGSPQISSTESVFGGASLYLNGSSYLRTPNTGDLTMRAKPFCFEARVRPNSVGSRMTLLSTLSATHGGAHEWAWLVAQDRIDFYYGVRGAMQSTLRLFTPEPVVANQWQAIALQRNENNEWECWLNGVRGTRYQYAPPQSGVAFGPVVEGTFVSSVDILNNGAPMLLGTHAFGEPYSGYIDELRYSIGQDVYTGDYTPATAPFPYP